EKVSELFFPEGAAEAASENILPDFRTLQAAGVLKKLVGVQHFVAEELVHITVKLPGAGSQNGVDVAAAVASLAGIVEGRLYFELLQHIRVRQRYIVVLRHVIVRRADSFDLIVVVVFTLPVHEYLCDPAPELRRSVQFALRTGAEGEQLLVVLRGQRQFTNRFRPQGRPGCRGGSVHSGDLSGNLHLLADGSGLQRNGYAGGLSHADLHTV